MTKKSESKKNYFLYAGIAVLLIGIGLVIYEVWVYFTEMKPLYELCANNINDFIRMSKGEIDLTGIVNSTALNE